MRTLVTLVFFPWLVGFAILLFIEIMVRVHRG